MLNKKTIIILLPKPLAHPLASLMGGHPSGGACPEPLRTQAGLGARRGRLAQAKPGSGPRLVNASGAKPKPPCTNGMLAPSYLLKSTQWSF